MVCKRDLYLCCQVASERGAGMLQGGWGTLSGVSTRERDASSVLLLELVWEPAVTHCRLYIARWALNKSGGRRPCDVIHSHAAQNLFASIKIPQYYSGADEQRCSHAVQQPYENAKI
ncbi:Hypothetical predicted protein [Cloeon dipterum]|uniref:Uncharacterized protein n=1 Tax=Cloeon dipterum TaxID=197152 RepID=A0A8S1EA65_9INSE|nr:Hypothetical predicted protein [Cloeon dipterum]